MKRLQKIALAAACGPVLCATLEAGTLASNPNEYASIAARNVFGLSPAPPTPAAVQPPEPAEVITPNGIAAISGQKWVAFKAFRPSSASQEKEKAYVLEEGQSQEGITVLKIDEEAGLVTFNNHGEIQGIPLAVVVNPNISGHIWIGNHLRH